MKNIRRGETTELCGRGSLGVERDNLPSNSVICTICATRIS